MNRNQKTSNKLVAVTFVIIALVSAFVVIKNMTDKSKLKQSFDSRPAVANQPTLGNPDAAVSIVEFGDYKCPACKAWGERIYPALIKDYINSGKATFTYINTPFHGKESALAAFIGEAVYKQDPDAFWSFHKALFDAQPTDDHDQEWITVDTIMNIVNTSTTTIDVPLLLSDLNNHTITSEIAQDESLVRKYNIQQTPSIMINGQLLADPFDYEAIAAIINKMQED